jgi:hypothetical protein
LIEKPNINYDAPILKTNKIKPDKVEYLLNIVGVNKNISSFETNTLYSILNNLPEIDPDGKKAKTLYRELAVNYEEKNLDTSEAEYKKFISEGKVFCKIHGKLSYENINSVFYIDNKRYGESIINQFHAIEIERRRSQEKIQKIFGVKPLKELSFTLANNPEPHNLNVRFEQDLEAFKPYVYVFRQYLDTTGKEKNLIKDVQFKLVTDLRVLLEKEKSEFGLEDYEYLYFPENKTVYIKTPKYLDDENKLKENVSFCSTIAEAFSALIDVDAPRQQIRELFSKSVSNRDDIIRAELDDINLEKLMSSKRKLGIVNDPKIQFWTSFIKCFPTKKIRKVNFTDESLLFELKKLFPDSNHNEVISTVFGKINYDNYNEETSLRLIIDLINKTNVSLLNFNKYVYPSVDIYELYELDFKRIRGSKKQEFKQFLYSTFISSDKDKKEFLNLLSQYDLIKGNFQNNSNYNVEDDLLLQLHEQFKINFPVKDNFNFEEIYSSNKNTYETKAEAQNISKELANQFINENNELESLLYFNTEIDALIDKLKNWTSKENKKNIGGEKKLARKRISLGNLDFFFDDFTDLFKQLENEVKFTPNISKINIKKIENKSSSSKGNKNSTSNHPMKPKQPTEDIGFLGEWLVYKHLLNSVKNRDSVKWVSKYAKLVNTDGKDGCGYDLEYIPNNAKGTRYVEVKVVGWENAFHISPNEISQGEKLKKHYEIFLVRNIGNTENISIEIIQAPFAYKGQNTFNDNELFTVINDSFILKFQKTDA